ncbi:hypothetical protein [Lactococcus lactis]|uniref:hypothetical protein n=1 Tax=Lactococcus lactis TaxID=1358 RepID=UPI002073F3E2|nr:hypothetical protein [Lactococcus lactis]
MENGKAPKPQKPIYKKVWFWLLVIVVVALGMHFTGGAKGGDGGDSASKDDSYSESSSSSSSSSVSSSSAAPVSSSSSSKTDDFSTVSKTYNLSAGNYAVGTDIPVGVANITATSGQGNLMTESGSINEMFGIDDGDGMYTSSYNNAELKKGDVLELNSGLKITLNYSEVKSNINPWTYNDSAAKQLGTGTYTVGKDFPAGVYKIVAVSGSGNLSDSSGIINEMFGVDDGSGMYNSQYNGAPFTDGDKLEVSGGVVINIVPANNK